MQLSGRPVRFGSYMCANLRGASKAGHVGDLTPRNASELLPAVENSPQDEERLPATVVWVDWGVWGRGSMDGWDGDVVHERRRGLRG